MNTAHTQPLSNQTPLLSELSVLDVTGDDAATFLHAQLTQDMLHWQAHEIKRAAWCTVKGRMLASFYVWPIEGGFRLIVSRDLLTKVLPRLRMFVLRAKVVLTEPPGIALYPCQSHGAQLRSAEGVFTLLTSGYSVTTDQLLAQEPAHDTWTSAHIQAGVAWVSAGNSEQFVPQTANFELVGGINFKKGCYPGQEIVARSQYLGKLKLRAGIAQVSAQVSAQLSAQSEARLADPLAAQSVSGAAALTDIYATDSPNPVGRVIQADGDWVLYEAPHTLIESGAALHVGSPTGAALKPSPLPYAVHDITA